MPVLTRFVYSRAARVARPSLECEGHLHDVEVYQPRADSAAEAPHGVVITHAPAQPVRCGVSFQILQTGSVRSGRGVGICVLHKAVSEHSLIIDLSAVANLA